MSKFLVIVILFLILGAYTVQSNSLEDVTDTLEESSNTTALINKENLTIFTRVNVPEGYSRVTYPKGSFQEYLRHYSLKPFGSKIVNYDDTNYFWQGGHIGVLEIPVPKNGLQQCAD
ncbi:MAG: DUF4846 domain-containing protein, partial [Algicola sp.]|nr:DUF4846 domain-containing protein [Algicola sp.]